MKIRSHIQAGYDSLEACRADVQYWKTWAQRMEYFAQTGRGPDYSWPSRSGYTPPTKPTNPYGVIDRSGYCG